MTIMKRTALRAGGLVLGAGMLCLLPWMAQAQYSNYFPDPRTRTIGASYSAAFCRPPDANETRFWLSDPRGGDITQLINAHRQFLRSNAGARTQMIHNSYYATFGRPAQSGEMAHWEPYVRSVGYTCEELKVYHTNYQRSNPNWRASEPRRPGLSPNVRPDGRGY